MFPHSSSYCEVWRPDPFQDTQKMFKKFAADDKNPKKFLDKDGNFEWVNACVIVCLLGRIRECFFG